MDAAAAAAAASATALTGDLGGFGAGSGISSLARGVASASEAGFMVVSTGGSSGLTVRGLRLVGGVDGGRGAGRASGVLGSGVGSSCSGATVSVIPLRDEMLYPVTSWSSSSSSSTTPSSSSRTTEFRPLNEYPSNTSSRSLGG